MNEPRLIQDIEPNNKNRTLCSGAMECSMNGGPAKDYIPEIRLDFYYGKKSKDFRLLMNLLAESSGGLAQSFRILCVFDKHFQKLWKIQDFKVISKKPTVYFSEDGEYIVQNKCETRSAWVLWNDAVMATYISKEIPKRPIGKFDIICIVFCH